MTFRLTFFFLFLSLRAVLAQEAVTWSAQWKPGMGLQLNGYLPTASEGDSYYFQYGTDSSQLLLGTEERFVPSDTAQLPVSEFVATGLYDTTWYFRLVLTTTDSTFTGNIKQVDIDTEKPVVVETRDISFPGSVEHYRAPSITLNGAVNGNNCLTQYYFEYGPTTTYGSVTPTASIGPALTSHFIETWDSFDQSRWFTWGNITHHPPDNDSSGFVRADLGNFLDYNHIGQGGVGFLMLPLYIYTESSGLGTGSPDFRDARMKVRIRGQNFVANNSKFHFWSQSQEDLLAEDWRRSNWDFNAYSMADALEQDGWTTHSFALENDATKWRYSGNNNNDWMPERYSYNNLNESLRNVNNDFIFALVGVDPVNRPTGSIDFDEVEINYRNYSLLHHLNGGRLISWPAGPSDPFTLTDGWKNGQEHNWLSEPDPGESEFTFAFDNPVTVDRIQLHQNTEFPSRTVVLLGSPDGNSFIELDTVTMPPPTSPADNFAFAKVDFSSSPEINFLRVRITEGYDTSQWGLAEIELFGSGADLVPGAEMAGVNRDIGNLQLDSVYHYRLVASNKFGTVYGEDKLFVVESNPIIFNTPDTIYYSTLDFQYTLSASWTNPDSISEAIKFHAFSKPTWLTFNGHNGSLSVNPEYPHPGDSLLSVMAFDPKGRFTSKTIAILYQPIENPITFEGLPPHLDVRAPSFTFTLSATHEIPNGFAGPIRFQSIDSVEWLTIDEDSGIISVIGDNYDVNSDVDAELLVLAYDSLGTTAEVNIQIQSRPYQITVVQPPTLDIRTPSFTFPLLATHERPDSIAVPIRFQAMNNVEWLTIAEESGVISIVADNYDVNSEVDAELIVRAYDSLGTTTVLNVNIHSRPYKINFVQPADLDVRTPSYTFMLSATHERPDSIALPIRFKAIDSVEWLTINEESGMISVVGDKYDLYNEVDAELIVRAYDSIGTNTDVNISIHSKPLKIMFIPQPSDTLLIDGKNFSYQITARHEPEQYSDAEIKYRLLSKPKWIAINDTTGTISVEAQVYEFTKPDSVIVVEAFDSIGRSTQVSIRLKHDPDLGEIHFVAPPDSLVVTGPELQHAILADWNSPAFSEYAISYRLILAPVWLVIDPFDGRLTVDRSLYDLSQTDVEIEAYSITGASTRLHVPLVNKPKLVSLPTTYVYQNVQVNLLPVVDGGQWTGDGTVVDGVFQPKLSLGENVFTYEIVDGARTYSEIVVIHVKPMPVIEARNANPCEGETTQLSGPPDMDAYRWSTGAATSSILVNGTGTYGLEVFDQLYGWSPVVPLQVDYLPRPPQPTVVETSGGTLTVSPAAWKTEWILDDVHLNNKSNEIEIQDYGTYTARTINESGCTSEVSAEFVVEPPQLVTVDPSEPVMKVYPNPSDGVFDVILTAPSPVQSISIFTSSGGLVEQRFFDNEPTSINEAFNLSTQSNGPYFCVVMTSSGALSRRFIVSK